MGAYIVPIDDRYVLLSDDVQGVRVAEEVASMAFVAGVIDPLETHYSLADARQAAAKYRKDDDGTLP